MILTGHLRPGFVMLLHLNEYREIFNTLPGVVAILDGKFKFVDVSQSFLDLTLTEKENLLDRNFFEHFSDNSELKGALRDARDSKVPQKIENFSCLGDKSWNISIRPVLQFLILHIEEAEKDIDDLKNAIQMRDEFLSVASHELKTPLTSLQLQMQMAKRSLLGLSSMELTPERIEKLVISSNKSIDNLARLVDDMLDISRISSGRLSLQLEEFDLSTLIEDCIERVLGTIANNPITIQYEAQITPLVYWDKFRIQQVLNNLLTNSIRYGNKKHVEVRLLVDNGNILIKVKDFGIGIGEGDLSRIFEKYERAIDANSISGLGLGLYISKEIVHYHHGDINVQSQLNEGSEFTIAIPQSPH
jgi:signal transduction histidine kinase